MQTAPLTAPSTASLRTFEPNEYVLRGQDVQVSYSSTSITGDPLLNYTDATHQVTARGEEQIRREETQLGTLVTVTLEPDADAGSLLLSLVIPHAQLLGPGEKVRITTLAVLTRSRFPRLPANCQLQTYRTLPLRGAASFVVS